MEEELTFTKLYNAIINLTNRINELELALSRQNAIVDKPVPEKTIPSKDKPSEFLTRPEAAKLFGLTDKQFYYLIYTHDVPYYKQGRNLFFSKEELINWMKTGQVEPRRQIGNKPPRKPY